MTYVDASALVKLAIAEPESNPLREFLSRQPIRVTCDLARTEVVRAVRRSNPAAVPRAQAILGSLHLIRLDDALLDAAALLDPASLRSLDAVHLAAARSVVSELTALVTYDRRMSAAATALGLTVVSPT